MPTRDDILRIGITKNQKIIEIGPSYNPLTPKAEGWHSYVVDHADRAGLIEKYRTDPAVNVAKIENVDFVWTEGPLADAVSPEHHGTFDIFIACHVLEHVPDLIGILRSAEALCRPEAKMILALPDKRVCFDFFRPLSTTGEILEAHLQGRSRHTAKSLWDTFAYNAMKHGGPGWGRADRAPLKLTYSLHDAYASTLKYNSGEYMDAHAWTFVPSSFCLILLELALLSLTDWQIERTEAAEYTEFYVWLKRGAQPRTARIAQSDSTAERSKLLYEILVELQDQNRQLSSPEETGLIDTLGRVEADLARTRNALNLIRGSRAWRIRSVLRNLLRMPKTLADV